MTARDDVTLVTGYSDDLIELDGAIYDEVSADLDGPTILAFPEVGVTLCITYDEDGIWRIERLAGSPHRVRITRCESREGYTDRDGDVYSDIAEVCGATEWETRLCDELDAAEGGVRWEDVDLETVTAMDWGGTWIFYRDSPGWPLGDEEYVAIESLLSWQEEPPEWFRDGTGWHKVADR